MDLIVSQNIKFLRSLSCPGQEKIVFPHSMFNYNRNKTGRSSYSLQRRMTHISTKRDPYIYFPFDADDLSRCLWWIIDNPAYWETVSFVSIAAASPEWKGLIVWFIPLVRELMIAPTLVEPSLSTWVRQIMNDSVDPLPRRNMEEARQFIESLKNQYTDTGRASFLEIRHDSPKVVPGKSTKLWANFKTKPQKLTNDLVTLASRDLGNFYIVAQKNQNEIQVLLQENNRWVTKITYAPIQTNIYFVNK